MLVMPMIERLHGGPDSRGVPRYDFSANGNACGPCPSALAAVVAADAVHYPDPFYAELRERLAAFHGVAVQRIVIAASGSEFVWRITCMVRANGGHRVWLPLHGYGDYAVAAREFSLAQAKHPAEADLAWACDPSSPLGEADTELERMQSGTVVLDRAYEPLRLAGSPPDERSLSQCWQLWSPNKALGLTGIRAAYAIAPETAPEAAEQVEALAASWPIGAHGVAMLRAWCEPSAQAWLAHSRRTLHEWKLRQIALCEGLGWQVRAGNANFHTATMPHPGGEAWPALQIALDRLREHGIKLRDCTSFGLPGHVRLSVQSPQAQDALKSAWEALA